MPVAVKRDYLVKSGENTYVFSQEELEKMTADTEITLTCSGPRCQARHARPQAFTLVWKEEELAKDPLKLPDEFFKVIKISINTSPATEFIFCGKECAKDWLTYEFVPPLSPREINERAKREQADQLAKLNPHLISPGDKVNSDIDKIVDASQGGEHVNPDELYGTGQALQADGDSGE
jgi:hypothetical protein